MSYEGFEERICKTGHYLMQDVYQDTLTTCPICDAEWQWYSLVDQTNGYEPNNPSTWPAPTEIAGIEELWKEDKYKNRYCIERKLYRPVKGSRWREYKKWDPT